MGSEWVGNGMCQLSRFKGFPCVILMVLKLQQLGNKTGIIAKFNTLTDYLSSTRVKLPHNNVECTPPPRTKNKNFETRIIKFPGSTMPPPRGQ